MAWKVHHPLIPTARRWLSSDETLALALVDADAKMREEAGVTPEGEQAAGIAQGLALREFHEAVTDTHDRDILYGWAYGFREHIFEEKT